MTKVSVHFEFDNMQEASRFFGDMGRPTKAAEAPQVATPPQTGPSTVVNAALPQSTTPAAASVLPVTPSAPTAASASPAPASPTNVDYGLEIRTAMSEMIGRLDKTQLGAGAVKAKEILNKHGFARARDVGADKAAAVLADFKAA